MSKAKGKKCNVFSIMIVLLILVQPFLDIYKYTGNYIELFGLSIIELINIFLVLGISVITVFKNYKEIRESKLKIIVMFLIAFIYILYVILHILHINSFDVSIYPQSSINMYKEVYYIFRSLLLPLILMACLYLNKFSKELFYKTICILTIIVSGIIVVSNIFGFSYIAYSSEKKIIAGNIFRWFNYTDSYVKPLTSKGLFFSANELSNLLVVLLPVNIYNYINKKKLKYIFVVFIQILSMIMLGTKTATYGELIILMGVILLTLFISFIKKVGIKHYFKDFYALYILFIIVLPLYYYSPLQLEYRNKYLYYEPEEPMIINRDNYEIKTKESKNSPAINFLDFKCNGINSSNQEMLSTYLKDNYQKFYVNAYYIERYSIDTDLHFWCQVFKNNLISKYDNRELKTLIFSRIQDNNNDIKDKYLGMGYTLNMLTLETDYYELYYQFGILGLILFVGPYIVLFLASAFYVIFHLRNKFNYESILLLVSAFCGIVFPHLGGHMYANIFVTIPYSLIVIMMYKIIKGEE